MHSPSLPKGLPTPVAVVGAACRLPGAPDVDAFWQLLQRGGCAIGEIGDDRWQRERFWHPRASEAGFSYTFAAGLLDDPFAFDPAAFGISPREAEQMDPQQRLLLELVWEALEDAGIPPSSLKGSQTGVFVGASSLDYGSRQMADPASIDAHFMAGNTLSIIANRISYIYGLNGPSFTVDTACSSSLVALDQAMLSIAAGKIDTAIVAGVNIIASPISFIGFSRAGMLSPTGLCRPFAAKADGYVRAEGGVVLVLRAAAAARTLGERSRAMIVATAVNSDGRTSGMTLPSAEAQRGLMESLYRDSGVAPADLAFVEAHGTGTRVGDPAEAHALGHALGRKRTRALPVGSVKSNIGHLEPASGLAGMLKAMLALEHRCLPASLHLDARSPDIAFEELNLAPAHEAVMLAAAGPLHAGVSSFGFGGTNAHAIILTPDARERASARKPPSQVASALLVISAHSEPALRSLAKGYSETLRQHGPAAVAAAAASRRDGLLHRLALPLCDAPAMSEALDRYARGERGAGVVAAKSPARDARVAFVYSGNGAQWSGMGRAAYARNAAFREAFDAIDAIHRGIAGWSLAEMLRDPALDEKIALTSIAQPLLFAIQSALTSALSGLGLRPDAVLGHSVGEIAAAEASGALTRPQAVEIIHKRSAIQELARDLGRMMALRLSETDAAAFIARSEIGGLEIAAVNGPSGVTLAGPVDSIAAAERMARKQRISARILAVDYPFHSRLLEPFEAPFMAQVENFTAAPSAVPFFSTVTGGKLAGDALGGVYWWRNIREPVRFADAVQAAARSGCGLFVEIGPQPILLGSVAESAPGAAAIASFDSAESVDGPDPVLAVLARAAAHGARLRPAASRAINVRKVLDVRLPSYPWQRTRFRIAPSSEAIDLFGDRPRHPLIGARLDGSAFEWRNMLDPIMVPCLADHRVDGEAVMPAAGFAEMALAAARDWLGDGPLQLEDFDIVQGLAFAEGSMREVAVRIAPEARAVEILSRPRMTDDWTLHARGSLGRAASVSEAPRAPSGGDCVETGAAEVYEWAARLSLEYGPEFRRVLRTRRDGSTMEVELAPVAPGARQAIVPAVLSPLSFDAALHGLFLICDAEAGRTYLPVRIGLLRVYVPGAAIHRAVVRVDSHSERSLAATIAMLGEDGAVLAMAEDVRFQGVVLGRSADSVHFRTVQVRIASAVPIDARPALDRAVAALPEISAPAEDWLLLTAFVRSLAHRVMLDLSKDRPVSIPALVEGGVLAPTSAPLANALLDVLAVAGLATESGGTWAIAQESGLPPAEAIARTLCADHPRCSAELVLAARLLSDLAGALRTGTPRPHAQTLLEQFGQESLLAAGGRATISEAVGLLMAERPEGFLRVVLAEPGSPALLPVLLPHVRAGRMAVTVLCANARRIAAAEARTRPFAGVEFADAGVLAGVLAEQPPFDLALFAGLPALPGGGAGLSREMLRVMSHALHPRGALLALQCLSNPVTDVLLGLAAQDAASSEHGPVGLPDENRFATDLADAGFGQVALRHAGPGAALAVASALPPLQTDAVPPPVRPVGIVTAGPSLDSRLAPGFVAELKSSGRAVLRMKMPGLDEAGWATALAPLGSGEAAPVDIVAFAGAARGEPAKGLNDLIARVSMLLRSIRSAGMRARVWLVTHGAFDAAADDGTASAVWAFGRVAVNEFPDIDIRRADISPDLADAVAVESLAGLLARPGAEFEILLGPGGRSAIRVTQGRPAEAAAAEAGSGAQLQLAPPGSPDRVRWQAFARTEPAADEVEIEVAASGVNFRDVMFSSGLLPDDMVAGGYAGASLGLECAGRIVRIGARVTGLKPGDAVTAFARGAFATHVTVPTALVLPLPAALAPEAAAGIPVAFLTAWYSLIHLARLKRNDWVLIHAAAGGVGLAAMQIARWRGARIVATAGSDDKRALVRLLGADMVLDSRSLAFADEIRRTIGGVDVVLNSLSGEAMEASIKSLRPFGRFVELGKRDYAANSRIGLRPFRQNLTYYGVDADRLLVDQRALARKLNRDLARRFAEGAFAPLPYRAFDADAIQEALLLMQRAGHVGKIVVRPPRSIPAPRQTPAAFAARAEGCHLVVGGASGFGFETVRWLADRGARTIVVASRRGAFAPETASAVADLKQAGIELIAAHVDVTRRDSVDWLVHWIEAQHGPLVGVMHAAMVLADGAMAQWDEAKAEAVLSAKIDGARHLDRATRDMVLDYFVMFSSATTLIGNPGQAAYVAANGFMEGLARRRRAEGWPALAVAWGPISDAGILARDAEAGGQLARRTGRIGLKAREALDHLGRLLARDGTAIEDAAVACAAIDWRVASRGLKILGSPTYSLLKSGAADAAADAIDLADMLRGKSEDDVREVLTGLIARQVAAILRVPPDDIDPRRPLSEIGMDSLMGLELKLAMESRLRVEIPLMAMTAGKSLADIVAHMTAQIRASQTDSPDTASPGATHGRPLLERHTGQAVVDEGLEALAEDVEKRRKAMTRFAG